MSEVLDRLRKAMRQEQARAVQAELRKGATIEQAMAATGTVKRFVEEQRSYLTPIEKGAALVVPDADSRAG